MVVADNFFTGRRKNVEHWVGHPNFDLIEHDISNPLYMEACSPGAASHACPR